MADSDANIILPAGAAWERRGGGGAEGAVPVGRPSVTRSTLDHVVRCGPVPAMQCASHVAWCDRRPNVSRVSTQADGVPERAVRLPARQHRGAGRHRRAAPPHRRRRLPVAARADRPRRGPGGTPRGAGAPAGAGGAGRRHAAHGGRDATRRQERQAWAAPPTARKCCGCSKDRSCSRSTAASTARSRRPTSTSGCVRWATRSSPARTWTWCTWAAAASA